MDLSGLNSLLFSIHLGLAAALKSPEFALSPDESDRLANAAANVARHYNVGASAKVMDWANLVMAAGAIYGPRMFLAKTRKDQEKKQQRDQAFPKVE